MTRKYQYSSSDWHENVMEWKENIMKWYVLLTLFVLRVSGMHLLCYCRKVLRYFYCYFWFNFCILHGNCHLWSVNRNQSFYISHLEMANGYTTAIQIKIDYRNCWFCFVGFDGFALYDKNRHTGNGKTEKQKPI